MLIRRGSSLPGLQGRCGAAKAEVCKSENQEYAPEHAALTGGSLWAECHCGSECHNPIPHSGRSGRRVNDSDYTHIRGMSESVCHLQLLALPAPMGTAPPGLPLCPSPTLAAGRGQMTSPAKGLGLPVTIMGPPPGVSSMPEVPKTPLAPVLVSVMSTANTSSDASPVIMTATIRPSQ